MRYAWITTGVLTTASLCGLDGWSAQAQPAGNAADTSPESVRHDGTMSLGSPGVKVRKPSVGHGYASTPATGQPNPPCGGPPKPAWLTSDQKPPPSNPKLPKGIKVRAMVWDDNSKAWFIVDDNSNWYYADGAPVIRDDQGNVLPEPRATAAQHAGTAPRSTGSRSAASQSASYVAQYPPQSGSTQASNPPPQPASILLRNPMTNNATLNYSLNGQAYQIAPGEERRVSPNSLIEFDRGNSQEAGHYTLTDGVYSFGPRNDGLWELYHGNP